MFRIIFLILSGLTLVACSPPQVSQDRNPNDPRLVSYSSEYNVGDVIVDNSDRQLYLIINDRQAMAYPVGIGQEWALWTGTERVTRKVEWPTWTPTPAMIARNSNYAQYAGGMQGGPDNPLGSRALYLGSTYYRIHGTHDPSRIGRYVSNGCINMLNEHVEDLYTRVPVGATVHVIG